MRQLFFLFISPVGAFGQTSQVPYDPITGEPTFTNVRGLHSYRGSYSSIRRVDFRNLAFSILDQAGKPAESFPLKNGHYKHDDPYGHYSADLDSVYYLRRSPSTAEDSALVLHSWFAVGGSSSSEEYATVFVLLNGHLRSVQQMSWDTHFQAGQPTESFDPHEKSLVIRTAHYIPGDAHCCVSAMDVIALRWDGAHFVQTGIQTELSQYGKEQGKTLPR